MDLSANSIQERYIDRVKSELKTDDLTRYDYIWDHQRISPFDLSPFKSVATLMTGNEWKIGASFDQNTFSNDSILAALNLGAQSLFFDTVHSYDWGKALKKVELSWLDIFIRGQEDSIQSFLQYCKSQKTKPDQFASFTESPTDSLNQSFSYHDTAVTLKLKWFMIIDQLKKSTHLQEDLHHIRILYEAGQDLVLNISMVRAIRIIWLHVLKSFGLVATPVYIIGSVSPDIIEKNLYMIGTTVMMTSLVLSGLDTIVIKPFDHTMAVQGWHIKAQHIIKEESLLKQTNDVLSGSFVIENLSLLIAKSVWEKIISDT